ncbi:hypothetical protein BP5796_06704 [Coleophoma crateriformis]|uniref:Uncharacterized protein n=1 Tax=Coleophoma crateriformis TaxID=565419 RepID=A0A3D8RPA1_9HELO|nr:hypothetical protein BP5796_06704 [Coleophoma crateriformis]
MQLKRKRSDSEISTTSSLLSSPPGAYNISLDMDTQTSTPSLFSSRTRKRYRDNRPDENAIHQNTLSLLFSAQQSQSQSQPHPQPQPQPQSQSRPLNLPPCAFQNLANVPVPATQASLHSFWTLPKARSASNDFSASSASSTPSHAPFIQATNCEDCDAALSLDHDAMDVDMDIDVMTAGGGAENWGCAACGKQGWVGLNWFE